MYNLELLKVTKGTNMLNPHLNGQDEAGNAKHNRKLHSYIRVSSRSYKKENASSLPSNAFTKLWKKFQRHLVKKI